MTPKQCDRCEGFGSIKTYANQAVMPINGRVVAIDWCIHPIVAALNAAGIETVACCCGHGLIKGRIDLKDGRVLTIDTEYRGQQRPMQTVAWRWRYGNAWEYGDEPPLKAGAFQIEPLRND